MDFPIPAFSISVCYCAAKSFFDTSSFPKQLNLRVISISYKMASEVAYMHQLPAVEPLMKDTHAAFTEPFARDAVSAIISQKISSLILLPETDLDANQLLNEAGMGSMLTAELRMFIHRTFEVDVPFDVLFKKATLNNLTDMIAQDLQASA